MSTPKRDTRLLFTIVITLSLILVLTYAGRLARKVRLDAEIAQWEQKIEQSKQRDALLQKELAHVNSVAYVQEVAHNEFGMVKSGESLVMIVPVKEQEARTTLEVNAVSTEPLWHKVLGRLGLLSERND